jgi:hypothetical protein
VVRERENAGHLDLLAGSCLMLTRTAVEADADARGWLAPIVHEISNAIARVAEDPGDHARRQQLADQALAVARRIATKDRQAHTTLAAPIEIGNVVAVDLMTFAGADPDEALAAVREEARRLNVPPPPPAQRSPVHVATRVLRGFGAFASLAAAFAWLGRRARSRLSNQGSGGGPDDPAG